MIPTERELFREKDSKLWRAPPTWAFMVLRYSGVFALVPGLFFTSLQNQHCQVAASLGEVGVVLVTGSAGLIFAYRVFAIWRYNKTVMVLVSVLYVFNVACWIAVGSQLRASQGPPTPFGSNCKLHPVPDWDPLPFASSVLFDTTVLLLTIIKTREDKIKSSAIGNQILRDNIIYFVILSVTNIVVLVINCLGPKFDNIKPVTLPYPTLMTTAMGTRVYLNLRLYNKRRHETSTLPQVTSGDTMRFKTNDVPIPLNSMRSATMVVQSTHVQKDWDDTKLHTVTTESL
ncbi:hypothetical protein JR316_0001453 [Psilocybe cubensis]|nr:hypothetical protein JR316_0001453 [Psilocybe cubensis]KAH9487378.1 hypothetical protein JR316_0001453 [Psilocybe cubensis]